MQRVASQQNDRAAKEYTMRIESIDALAKAGSQDEVLAEVALLKSLPLQLAEKVAALPPLLATFRDERALYWIFSGRALCTLRQLSSHARLDEDLSLPLKHGSHRRVAGVPRRLREVERDTVRNGGPRRAGAALRIQGLL